MSFIRTISLKVRDMDALKTAADVLGLEFREGQTRFKTYDGTHGCEHAIGVPDDPGGYEVGVLYPVDASDDRTLQYDPYGAPKLSAILGDNGDTLKQEYAVAVSEKNSIELARQGYTLTRENMLNGSVRLRLTR